MPTTYYYTVNDEIIGEHTLGQSRVDYLTDALGSVVQTGDQSLSTISTARYKPYGSDLAITGTGPKYGWVGNRGYRRTSRSHADEYIRARTYSSATGSWTSLDPIWPMEPAFLYVSSNPICHVDPSGFAGLVTSAGSGCSSGTQGAIDGCCGDLKKFLGGPGGLPDPTKVAGIVRCFKAAAPTFPDQTIIQMLNALFSMCGSSGGPNICFFCQTRGAIPSGLPSDCSKPCDSTTAYASLADPPIPEIPIGDNQKLCARNGGSPKCREALRSAIPGGCDGAIVRCSDFGASTAPTKCATLYHELMHVAGLVGLPIPPGNPNGGHNAGNFSGGVLYAMACCICRQMYPSKNGQRAFRDPCQDQCAALKGLPKG